MSACHARQYSDQMLCRCGLGWDMNDPEPPECPNERRTATARRSGLQAAAANYKRERFERWAIKEGYSLARNGELYIDELTRAALHGFASALELP